MPSTHYPPDSFAARGRTVSLLLAVGCLALTGCTETSLFKWKREEVLKATPQNPALEMLCIWQPAEGRGVNGLPTRGFSGQILFFTRRHPSPVEVDGDVRVYVFDNQGTLEAQARPLHQFDFTPEIWNMHLQAGTLGPSYNVFIPYSRKGTHHAECALRVRFTPADGPAIYSDMAYVTLPGPMAKSNSDAPSGSQMETFDLNDADRFARERLSGSGPPASDRSVRADHIATLDRQTRQLRPVAPSRPAPSAAADPPEERIDRLEQMLARFLEAQAGAAPAQSSAPAEPAEPPRRFRLTSAARPAEPLPADAWYQDDSDEPPPPRHSRRHPLDETPHPLSDAPH